jgi:hypothetical protein
MCMRSQDLKDAIQSGVKRVKEEHIRNIINEFMDDAIIEVSHYRTQFKFKLSTAIKYTLIYISDKCNSISRSALFKGFNLKCKNIN